MKSINNAALYHSETRSVQRLMENQTNTGQGYWMIAKPIGIKLWMRAQAAWWVLRGKACAVTWA